jgi:Right handed beta helix region
MQHYRLASLAVFTSAILLISLVTPQNAFAQDETPPPTEVPAATDQPAVTEEANAADEATATEEPAATPESAATEAPVQEQASVSEILDQVPEGTDLVVLGTDGEAEPLASQAAAETIVEGDPMWCPTGQTPGTDMNDTIQDCTDHFSSFADLIVELTSLSESGAGTIYIDMNYDAATAGDVNTAVVFDYGAMGLTDLVFQGGWDFGLDQATGYSLLNMGTGRLEFRNWAGGSLTIRDLVIGGGGGLLIRDSTGLTTADVTLERVSVTGAGVGTSIRTIGSVSISESDFSNNAYGLDVQASGNITLNGVTANQNAFTGASLFNCGCNAGGLIVNGSVFNNNGGPGLIALFGDNVTISDTDTFGNDGAGIIIDSYGNVFLTGLNSGYNGDIGVGVSSTGNVSVANSWIGFNDAAGFGVQNGGNVTLANSAFFDNALAGAFVTSNGVVNVSNSYFGRCFFGSSMCGAQQVGLTVIAALGSPMNISNSQFNQNTSTGLILISGGDVVLENVTADGNGFVGAVVQTTGSVQVCGGSYSDNYRFGFTSTANTVFMSETTLLSGNGDAPVDLGPGTTVVAYDCAPRKVKSVELTCSDGQTGVELYLPNRDSMIVPCPMRGPASLSSLDISQLPGNLPDGFTFVSGLDAQAARDDLTVSFVMPLPDTKYTILYWNDTTWVELKGVATEDGKFAVGPVSPGIYVLATK